MPSVLSALHLTLRACRVASLLVQNWHGGDAATPRAGVEKGSLIGHALQLERLITRPLQARICVVVLVPLNPAYSDSSVYRRVILMAPTITMVGGTGRTEDS